MYDISSHFRYDKGVWLVWSHGPVVGVSHSGLIKQKRRECFFHAHTTHFFQKKSMFILFLLSWVDEKQRISKDVPSRRLAWPTVKSSNFQIGNTLIHSWWIFQPVMLVFKGGTKFLGRRSCAKWWLYSLDTLHSKLFSLYVLASKLPETHGINSTT